MADAADPPSSVIVGARYFMPFDMLSKIHQSRAITDATHGRGWFVTVEKLLGKEDVELHCDGDGPKCFTIVDYEEFVGDCTFVGHPPPPEPQQSQPPPKRPSPPAKRPKLELGKASGQRCEKNPLCTRGFKHGGYGGCCSVPKQAASGGSSSSKPCPATKPSPPAEPPVTTSQRRERRARLPEPEDELVGLRIRIAFEGDGKWYSAYVLRRAGVSNFSGQIEYVVQFHSDGKQIEYDLKGRDVAWERLGEEEANDAYIGTGPPPQLPPPPPPTHEPQQPPPPRTAAAEKRRAATTTAVHNAAAKQARKQPRNPSIESSVDTTEPVRQLVAEVLEGVLARARDAEAAQTTDLRVMRKLRGIEWFAGSARLDYVLHSNHGWQMTVHDRDRANIEEEAQGAIDKEGMRYDAREFEEVSFQEFYREAPFDYMHLSIDCSSFTGLSHAGQSRNASNDFLGLEDGSRVAKKASEGDRLLSKAVSILEQQLERAQEKEELFLFTLENPFGGRMKGHPEIAKLERSREQGGLGAKRIVLDFCMFGCTVSHLRPFKKRTIFWTNSPSLVHELGVADGTCLTGCRYLCEYHTPCSYHRNESCVAGSEAQRKAATPFPKPLATVIARCINRDAAKQRWRPQKKGW